MKGYLLQQQDFRIGEEILVESQSSENNYAVIFEDDGETGYFYALRSLDPPAGQEILDALHIYECEDIPLQDRPSRLQIIWSQDWLKCALVLNNYCHAIFDFQARGGYNRHEFPPPNEIWTQGSRALTPELITSLFGD